MNYQTKTRAFTLIELLVVIAIIALLAAVILAALATARNGGGNAAVKSDLQTIRDQAEIYFSSNAEYGRANEGAPLSGSYCNKTGNMFNDDTTISNAIQNAFASGINTGTIASTFVCWVGTGTGNPSGYLIIAPEKTTGTYWCVDSSGQSKQEPGEAASGPTEGYTTNSQGAFVCY